MQLDPRAAGAFLRFAGGFWQGSTTATAWLLTLGLGLSLTLSTAVTVGLNRWQRWFFDALEKKDAETAAVAVLVFLGIIVAMAAIGVAIVVTRETLQVRWRAWIVERLVGLWIGRHRFYHLSATHTEPDNPEYRISDDTRWATEPLVDLVIGIFSSVIGAAAFISILWSVGGSLKLSVGGVPLVIPAYMVLLALAYGALASGLMLWIGRALVGCVAAKNAAEGEFRFALMRMRENAESVALSGGGDAEQAALKGLYGAVVGRWLAIVRQHGRITWITNASGPMIPIVPLLFAAPKYFAGEFSLGEVVQLAAAFVQVQLAISWIVDNYNRLAEWFASARRVMDIVEACDGLDNRLAGLGGGGIRIVPAHSGGISVRGLQVDSADGKPLVGARDLDIPAGARVHIHGSTSAGKSSLVRALSGLWPWGRGEITVPAGARLMVVPQKPYLPTGTLRGALLYPDRAVDIDETGIRQALADAGLGHLAERLDAIERWDQVLGNGERQRLCVARALVHRPDILILDDALAALDEASQAELEDRLMQRLARATLISLSQRPRGAASGIARFAIDRTGGTAALRSLEEVPA
ncbi:MAG: ABC transporter ATP-binding protein/permease [Hyphomicrobiaceae bacterium]|nr:ABC transporter ATP-binding protein/permease [Hyphomicrobiaceae bacterium]